MQVVLVILYGLFVVHRKEFENSVQHARKKRAGPTGPEAYILLPKGGFRAPDACKRLNGLQIADS
jgi:hypothetical protein